jgi:hypothetical protein
MGMSAQANKNKADRGAAGHLEEAAEGATPKEAATATTDLPPYSSHTRRRDYYYNFSFVVRQYFSFYFKMPPFYPSLKAALLFLIEKS